MSQTSQTAFPQTWDLENVFKNSGKDSDYETFTQQIEKNLHLLKESIDEKNLSNATSLMQSLYQDLYTLSAFATCLFSENVKNTHAITIEETFRGYQSTFDKLSTRYDLILKKLSNEEFDELLNQSDISSVSFYIREKRQKAEDLLSLKEEELISDLSVDGYHGFSQMFNTFHGHLKFQLNNETLSYGQIENKISSSNREERVEAFKIFKEVFKSQEENFAQMLNHIAGFRLKVYEKRGWDSPIKEPLFENRMNEKTLNSMYSAISKHGDMFKQFMERKAKLLGLEKLSWHDIDPPVAETTTVIPYDEACELIIEQFTKLSEDLAEFTKKALKNHWIDAEDRNFKSAGGFCIGFPHQRQSRIFMTYSGTQSNVATLAHELGHAYHNEVIFDLPPFAQTIKMNVAETASTMAEMIVSDALYQKASSKEEKIVTLDDKISRAIAFCMNLQARFAFEKAFYLERKKGYVLPDKLCLLMEDAQKKAYLESLSEYHPHFWASKLHFYFTDVPFYNFPYTFGFLFSLGFYELVKNDPKKFETTFRNFLEDSAQMTTEDLAKKHLNYDLEKQDFWDLSMSEIKKSIDEFLKLTD